MTNDLMRDYLDGKIRCPRQARAEHRERTIRNTRLYIDTMTAAVAPIIEAYEQFGQAVNDLALAMQRAGVIETPPPADPRERALRAKQQRGTGPDVPVRERGLVTKYKEKF